MSQDLEILVPEAKLSQTNWLIICIYKPPSLIDITFISEIRNVLTFYRSSHGSFLLMWDSEGTVMQIEKALINDRLLVSKVS